MTARVRAAPRDTLTGGIGITVLGTAPPINAGSGVAITGDTFPPIMAGSGTEVTVRAAPQPDCGCVTLDELKAAMRVEHNREDVYIRALAQQACAYVNRQTSWYWCLPRETEVWVWGEGTEFLELPPPIAEVISIVNGGATPSYVVRRNHLRATGGAKWPACALFHVKYRRGVRELPGDIRAAVIRIVTHWFEHRSPVQDSGAVALPLDVDSTLKARRMQRAG